MKKSGKNHVGHHSFFGNPHEVLNRAKGLYRNKIEATVKDENNNDVGRVWEEGGKWNYSIDFGKQEQHKVGVDEIILNSEKDFLVCLN